MTKIKPFLIAILLFSFIAPYTISCSNSTSGNESDVDALLEEVRSVTQAFHNFDAAQAAGWSVDLSGCVEHPEEGGMGHHFGRLEFIDGRVNHLEPQILLYEPTEAGGFAFIGVEYIVPFEILPSTADAPVLFEQHFHQNPMLEIWALHVWTERDNPKGIFYDWNPTVSCQFADDE